MEMVNWEVEFQGDTFSFTVSVQGQPPSGIVVMDGNRLSDIPYVKVTEA